MKTIKRELAHVGMFGPDGVKITQKHLADCKETFDGKCPIALGHRLADWMPKFGNVKSVELAKNGDSLVGEVDVNDLLADAVDAKFYEDISVGISTRKVDGKNYLHHLAFLGAVPPKIRDLEVFEDLGVAYFAEEEPVLVFVDTPPSDPAQVAQPETNTTTEDISAAIRRIAERGRSGWPMEDVTKALAELMSWCTEMVLGGAEIPATLREQMQTFADQLSKPAGKSGKEDDLETKEELEANKAELEKTKTELADSKATILATQKESLKKAMEGRIPKAKQGLVLQLADQLGTAGSIELADEGGNKETLSSLDVLKKVLESIPLPVTPGREQLSDDSDGQKPVGIKQFKGKI